MARPFMLCVALAGCAYKPGSFAMPFQEFSGTRLTIGCLDLAVSRKPNSVPMSGRPREAWAPGDVVGYAFGNRCGHRVPVDLASVRVVARDADGRDVDLVAYDPRHEIRSVELPALWSGNENIEYDGTTTATQLCVDVGGIDASAPRAERWICMAGEQR